MCVVVVSEGESRGVMCVVVVSEGDSRGVKRKHEDEENADDA